MGTNYYLKTEPDKTCDHCGHTVKGETLHIGKSSGGWCFALHVMPERGINDLEDWLALFERETIEDEYGRPCSAAEMLSVIRNRAKCEGPRDPWARRLMEEAREHTYRMNGAEPGPGGLLRSKLDSHTIAHGDGTWDCIVGDFS